MLPFPMYASLLCASFLYAFFYSINKREGEGEREEEGGGGEGERRVLASPLKQNLVILALVIYKILETSPCN
jgi:hypothetical protein